MRGWQTTYKAWKGIPSSHMPTTLAIYIHSVLSLNLNLIYNFEDIIQTCTNQPCLYLCVSFRSNEDCVFVCV